MTTIGIAAIKKLQNNDDMDADTQGISQCLVCLIRRREGTQMISYYYAVYEHKGKQRFRVFTKVIYRDSWVEKNKEKYKPLQFLIKE